jgi:hypothetical protein
VTCGDSSTVEQPAFLLDDGGAIPTSPLHFRIEKIDVHTACKLNEQWHSRLPQIHWSNVVRNKHYICFGARYDGHLHAVAIWSSPVAANRLKDGQSILELRRFAISSECPANTGSRMLAIMSKEIVRLLPEITRLISYQDTEVHQGTIYKAAGWTLTMTNKGISWTTESRTRNKEQSTAPKARWELDLTKKSTQRRNKK